MIKEIGWVVQENLSSDRYVYDAFKKIFEKNNIPHTFVQVIPFDDKLPEFDKNRLNIFYGSTTMMMNVYNIPELRPGLFYEPSTFGSAVHNEKWGELMLNHGASITSFKELEKERYSNDKELFIRPTADSKIFSGQIMTFSEIKDWKNRITALKDDILTDETPILVGEPYGIKKEWRNFVVEGKVISSSRYIKDQRLSKSADDVSQEMIDFCEKACTIFTPHDIFVMDIAISGGDYYIIECGCINSTGFYSADQEKIVLAITEYMERNKWKFNGL